MPYVPSRSRVSSVHRRRDSDRRTTGARASLRIGLPLAEIERGAGAQWRTGQRIGACWQSCVRRRSYAIGVVVWREGFERRKM
jgi:hypothetical protein